MSIEWTEQRSLPSYHYCSEDGLIDADVEHGKQSGWWNWSAAVMEWTNDPVYHRGDVAIDGNRNARTVRREHGRARTAEEAMAAAQAWLAVNA